jgi:hypothetical protein
MTANGFRRLVVGWMVVAALGTMPAAAQPVVLAQPGQPAQAGRMQRPYASPWSGSIQWLAMPEVQKDLELIDDQIEKINKIRQELQQEMQSSYKTLSSVPGEERQQKYYDLSVELSERTEIRKRSATAARSRGIGLVDRLSPDVLAPSGNAVAEILAGDPAERLDRTELQRRIGIVQRCPQRLYGGTVLEVAQFPGGCDPHVQIAVRTNHLPQCMEGFDTAAAAPSLASRDSDGGLLRLDWPDASPRSPPGSSRCPTSEPLQPDTPNSDLAPRCGSTAWLVPPAAARSSVPFLYADSLTPPVS